MDVNELDSAKVSPGALKNAVGHVPGSMMYLVRHMLILPRQLLTCKNRYISTLMSCDMQSIAQKRNSDPAKLQVCLNDRTPDQSALTNSQLKG